MKCLLAAFLIFYSSLVFATDMIKDGVASMHSLNELNVPAGESFAMVPGGIHVMLMKPSGIFIKGDTVELQLMFADGVVAFVEAKLGKLN